MTRRGASNPLEETQVRYALLWLLGVPIPVLILIYFLFH
jgi:hypothetical protein